MPRNSPSRPSVRKHFIVPTFAGFQLLLMAPVADLEHHFDLARAPFLREERLARAVQAQDREPAFAGHGLDPVAPRDAGWLGGAEMDCRGAVGIRLGGGRGIALVAGTREALRRVEHRSRLVVVE